MQTEHPSRHARVAPSRSGKAAGWILCLELGACEHPGVRPTDYFATIVRVDRPVGLFCSPAMEGASRPLTQIYLRLRGGNPRSAGAVLRLAVLDSYDSTLYGAPEDSVSFGYSGSAPTSGELAFEDLLNYKVVPRRGKPSD
ncbi:MAG TPA: hypothetical protein VN775_10855 [Opitutaceae bacterium]|nr:hypothetical protein [Opitutaceae bacterium]